MNRFLFILALCGCAAKHIDVHSNVPTAPSEVSSGEVVIPFTSTGSACLDAMRANFELAQCTGMSTTGEIASPVGVQVYCNGFNPARINPWVDGKFLVMMTSYVQSENNAGKMVCMDALFTVFQTE